MGGREAAPQDIRLGVTYIAQFSKAQDAFEVQVLAHNETGNDFVSKADLDILEQKIQNNLAMPIGSIISVLKNQVYPGFL